MFSTTETTLFLQALSLLTCNLDMASSTELTLFDFTATSDPSDWYESSDTVREPGMSKATFVLQQTKVHLNSSKSTALVS